MDIMLIALSVISVGFGIVSIIKMFYDMRKTECDLSISTLVALAKTNSAVSKIQWNLNVFKKQVDMVIHVNIARSVMNTLTGGETFEKLQNMLDLYIRSTSTLKCNIKYIEE